MTSGAAMMAVGVYLMLFANIQEIGWLKIAGAVLATIGFVWSAIVEDEYLYRLRKLEAKNNDFKNPEPPKGE